MTNKPTLFFILISLTCYFTWHPVQVCLAEQKDAFVRTEVQQITPLYAGQKISFYVSLYSKTQFTGVPRFELPQVSGMIFMEVEDRPVLGRTEEDGEEFLSKTHEFAVFPQKDGHLTIPSFPVTFACMDTATGKAAEATYPTNEMQIDVTRPPGTKNITPIIATREFIVQAAWEPQPDKPKVGDAFTLTITRTAKDIPGMVFVQVSPEKINGLGIYENPPSVKDEMERGDFTGKRTDVITYVCEKKGKFKIPGLSFHWFNLETEQLETEHIDPVIFKVASNPQYNKTDLVPANGINRFGDLTRWILMGVIFLSLAVLGFLRFRKQIAGRYHAWKIERSTSEKYYFKKFVTTCRSGEAPATLQALFEWMNRLRPDVPPVSLRQCLSDFQNPDLLQAFSMLEQQAYGPAGMKNKSAPFPASTLLNGVKLYRKHQLNISRQHVGSNRLEPLNP